MNKVFLFSRLKDELVQNYYSGGTLERLAMHHGLFNVLAGDLSHSRSVNRCVHPLSFSLLRADQFVVGMKKILQVSLRVNGA